MHVQHQANSSFCTLVPLSKVQFTLAFYTQGILYCTYIGTAQIHIFLYQVWLLIRPKFSRKFIQRADVLHTVCFPACLLEICANVWKANAGFFFLVYSTCMIFLFTKFSLAWIFFFFVLCPPTITFLMIRPLRWIAQERANNPTARKINICISARRKTWKSDKTEKLLVRDRHTLLYQYRGDNIFSLSL